MNSGAATITIRACSGPGAVALLVFMSLYLVAVQYCRLNSYRDPTSFFFDPARAYLPEYSSVRQREADAYIQAAATAVPYQSKDAGSNKTLCVGVASVAREGTRYFRTSVGSILEGLTEEERESIFLILFIAHTDQTVLPAFSETWLHNVPDQVLHTTYRRISWIISGYWRATETCSERRHYSIIPISSRLALRLGRLISQC